MSKKSDLLVRVRYLNPVPNPPFPPKLLDISTDINRLGEPSYLNHLAASTQLPMLVDSEMGMPLDLNEYDGIWDGQDQSLNPALDAGRVHHPIDVALLAPFNPPPEANGDVKAPVATEVSWMRNNNYLTRKNNARRKEAAEAKAEEVVDASEAAQIMAIEKSFHDLYEQDPKEIKHPDKKKRGLTVVESYDILPDVESWENSYALVRFPERPSAATAINPAATASSPRLAKAILRPIREDEDQQLIEFYLPKEEDLTNLEEAYERAIPSDEVDNVYAVTQEDPNDPTLPDIFSHVHYDRIRMYEVLSAAPPTKEILVSFQEDQNDGEQEDGSDEDDERPKKRRKGVYYHEINFRTLLRKTRAKRREEVALTADLWDKAVVGYRQPAGKDEKEREMSKAQVSDPTWVNEELRKSRGGDNMAELQGEAIQDEDVELDEEAQKIEAAVHEEEDNDED
ncbi:RNA polymerase II-associated factor 1 [Kwoniella mangroviensis CBS 10435]|uniref:RNA polymerase II-associated factor 1 n=1 Tax=Kwoniella mangroviensis CBS 10435 TaxID=1331196 RepID=A0A1B9INQ9_9TREE|nr:RNA polymerase II-associated factor 1 [Kwoniella mangroviensis CBS 8507]OCF57219.1 RNA polymerase II-associated factor 1 [Kwoniella mangroviensis CBS 10435]OCF70449.1 RNA polymerase II-associated factor 1 [Kwoniella mangroviensis CBS 8507]